MSRMDPRDKCQKGTSEGSARGGRKRETQDGGAEYGCQGHTVEESAADGRQKRTLEIDAN